MRMLNEVGHLTLGETPDGRIEGVVRVRGFEAVAGGRSFGYQRHEPEAIVIRGEDEVRRLPVSAGPNRLPAFAIPVAAYIAARMLLRGRRGR
jgi:hypothetical protein